MGKKDRRQRTEGKGQKKRKWKIGLRIPKFLIPKDEPIVPRTFTSIDYAGGIVVFFICWAVYLHTLTPTIGFHDSGDMVTAAYVLGIPHPTGYPLYCLLGKLWMTILPIGNIAYRMNLASALCASLSCMMVYFIVLKVGGGVSDLVKKRGSEGETSNTPSLLHFLTSSLSHLIPAMVAALMLAFATTFWEQAVIAEKYTLNALFATLLIFILLKWQGTMIGYKNPKSEINSQFVIRNPQFYLYLFAFTLGLSFTHHMQTIYLVPASIFFIIAVYWKKCRQEKQTLKPKSFYSLLPAPYSLLKMLCIFILPLLLYLYLPIRASAHPVYNWGDPETLKRFIGHITGEVYKGYFTSEMSKIYKNLSHIPYFLMDQFTQYFWWISLVGFLVLLFKKRTIPLFFFLIIIVNIFFAMRYSIPNVEDYYIFSYIVFSILFNICMGFIGSKILQRYKIFYFLFFIFPIISFLIHYSYNNRNDYYFAYDYGRNLLRPVEEKGIVFLKGIDDDAFPLWYLHYAEHIKPDIDLVSILFMYFDWYPKQITHLRSDRPYSFTGEKDIMRVRFDNIFFNNQRQRPIYTHYDENFATDYSLVNAGIFYRVLNKHISNDILLKELYKHKLRFMCRGIKNNKIHKDNHVEVIVNNYISIYNNYGIAYNRLGEYSEAIREYKQALQFNPANPDVYFNIGEAYTNLRRYDEAIHNFKKAIAIDTNYVKGYKGVGNVYENKKELDEAIKWYKKAIEIEPKNIENHRNLARVYYKMGNFNEVIIECKRMIEIDPQNVEFHNDLGSVYFKKGNYEKATLEFKEVLKLDPENIYAHKMLANITEIN